MRRTTHSVDDPREIPGLTHHARARMCGRRMSADVVLGVIAYGRIAHVRGATIYAVGRKEVSQFSEASTDLEDMEGVHVVCSRDGAVMTVYRNHDFRGLRPRSRGRRRGIS